MKSGGRYVRRARAARTRRAQRRGSGVRGEVREVKQAAALRAQLFGEEDAQDLLARARVG